MSLSESQPNATLVDKLVAFFRARPYVWVDGRELGPIAGNYAWRSRVSDARTRFGLTIINRQRRVKVLQNDAMVTITISEYKFIPERAVAERAVEALARRIRAGELEQAARPI